MSAADVEYKFRHVVASCLRPQDIDRVVDLVARLEQLDDVSELIALVAAPRAQA
jgi:hypothetical protein